MTLFLEQKYYLKLAVLERQILQNAAITNAKLANGAVTAGKLANSSIATLAATLPASGTFTGQLALDTDDNSLYMWSGSATKRQSACISQ